MLGQAALKSSTALSSGTPSKWHHRRVQRQLATPLQLAQRAAESPRGRRSEHHPGPAVNKLAGGVEVPGVGRGLGEDVQENSF